VVSMPKMTVIDMVQDILNDMDSDEVSSINDTVEAQQVAQILKTTYYEILGQRVWPHTATLTTLTASGSTSLPTHMTIADDIIDVAWIKYNKKTDVADMDTFTEIVYLTPEEFMSLSDSRASTASDITNVTDPSGVTLNIITDTHPTYYTSFDDETLIFDSYYSTLDTTLQTSKTQVYGYTEPTFSLVDTFTPDLPTKAFPYYLAEAKSTAFNALKQAPNAKEEQRVRRQKRKLSRTLNRSGGGGITFPDYGRN